MHLQGTFRFSLLWTSLASRRVLFFPFQTIRTSSLDPGCLAACLLRQFPVRFPKPFCPGYKSGLFHLDPGDTLFARRRHSASPAAVCSGILGRIKLSTVSLPPHLSLLSHLPSLHLPQGLPCCLCLWDTSPFSQNLCSLRGNDQRLPADELSWWHCHQHCMTLNSVWVSYQWLYGMNEV